jgi:uncharacterized tellurite resistance protein B-like protein
MIAKIKQFLNSLDSTEPKSTDNTVAIVSLLCEVCLADQDRTSEEEAVVVSTLRKLIDIDEEKAAELLHIGMKEIKTSNSVFDFTSQLGDLDSENRIALIKSMWEVAYADGELDEMEEALIRKVAALIYVSHSDFIKTKLSVLSNK